MSDDAEQYYNAWSGVFGPVPKKLLCSWHVDRAWKKAIYEHIIGPEAKLEVSYAESQCTVIDFQILLAKAMSFFEENHPRFYQYMKTMYASRAEQWASCYRLNTQLDTNMHVETFHRVIKIDYLKHKQNRRIDHLLHILFKYNRDLVFNFLRKEIFGKRSHKVCEIMMHHRATLKTCEKGNADIVAIDDYTWIRTWKMVHCGKIK